MILDWLIEPFQYDFMVRAFANGALSALLCGLLSCWLVLLGWSLMGDAVSHAVLPGVVLAYFFGAPFAVGALIAAIIAVTLIGTLRNTSRLKEDTVIGIVFTVLFALGLVLISVTPSNTDLSHILFGNILGVSSSDLLQIFILTAIALTVLLYYRRSITLFAFDPAHAQSIGINPKFYSALLLGVLAVTVVASLQTVGVILVVALLIIPGATAYLLSKRLRTMLWLSPVLAVAASTIGIYLSYWFDTASGGMIVLTMGGIFTCAYLFSPREGIIIKAVQKLRGRRKNVAEYQLRSVDA